MRLFWSAVHVKIFDRKNVARDVLLWDFDVRVSMTVGGLPKLIKSFFLILEIVTQEGVRYLKSKLKMI